MSGGCLWRLPSRQRIEHDNALMPVPAGSLQQPHIVGQRCVVYMERTWTAERFCRRLSIRRVASSSVADSAFTAVASSAVASRWLYTRIG